MSDTQSALKDARVMILGCGYVGEAVARGALAAGARVHALTRNPNQANALRELGVESVVVARLDSTAWHAQTDCYYDHVLNCVSAASPDMEGYRQSYVEGMRSVLAWTRTHLMHVGTVIYTSSTGVYPQGDGQCVDESASLEPASERASLLLEAERILREEIPCAGWFVLRLAGIYGPGRHGLLNQLMANETTLAGSGEHTMNLIHRDDAARAILTCMTAQQGQNSVYNLSDNAPLSKAECVRWCCELLGRSVPDFDSEAARSRSVPNRRIDSSRIQRELGWTPRFASCREGYRALLQRD